MSSWTTYGFTSSESEQSQLEAFEISIRSVAKSELEKTAGSSNSYLSKLAEEASTPRLDRLSRQTKIAQIAGRDLARSYAKTAGLLNSAMGAIKPLAGKALGMAAMHPHAAMAAGGAALGAAGGAAAGGPGNRIGGALGGAALGGAAGFGASKIPGGFGAKATQSVADTAAKGYRALGQPKLAYSKVAGLLSSGLGRAGLGAAAGGVLGAVHSGDLERQGLAPGHHLRNALMGAAGGAALGGALHHMPTGMTGSVENAMKPGAGMGHSPYMKAPPTVHTPADLRQMERVKNMANSPMADQARDARAMHAKLQYMQAHPSQFGEDYRAARAVKRVPAAPMAGTVPGKAPSVNPALSATMMKAAHRGGASFLKMAFSMSAQAEPGDPTGAQEPEAESQSLMAPIPQRPPSKPAVDLYDALKHLSPKSMKGLQVAQPGT